MSLGKEDNKLTGAELGKLLRWKLTNKGMSQFPTKAMRLAEWIRIKDRVVPEIQNPGEDQEEDEETEEAIPSVEDTMLGRKKAESVEDAWRVLGGIPVEDIEAMLNTRKESESQGHASI